MAEPRARAAAVRIDSWTSFAQVVSRTLRQRDVGPAEVVVLLPYPALVPLAREAWRNHVAEGFAPRFETPLQCANRVGGAVPGPGDVTYDAASDRLTSAQILVMAGLQPEPALVSRCVERAYALAPVAAAAGPKGRPLWAATARRALGWDMPGSPTALDTAVNRVALEWCISSQYATDILFGLAPEHLGSFLVVLHGVALDPMGKALLAHADQRGLELIWDVKRPDLPVPVMRALDAGDEADLAAACVLHHLEQGRSPVALVANDRFLTRRVSAQLDQRGVTLHDETGWTLSTTRMAAHVMGALRACARDAGSDEVLEWLKSSPAFAMTMVSHAEQTLRRAGEPQWARFAVRHAGVSPTPGSEGMTRPDVSSLLATVEALRSAMCDARTLADWLAGMRVLLHSSGLWQTMEQDAAGEQVIRALRLSPDGAAEIARHEAARRPWSLTDFVSWVDAVLEAQRFMPPHEADAQVLILPMSQVMGRDFAALVMPGCDERQVSASPDPQQGPWSTAQRVLLGLPGRADIEAAQRLAWAHAIAAPCCQLLWHEKELGNEPVLPSQLLVQLQLDGLVVAFADPRAWQEFSSAPIAQARAQGERLVPLSVSASAYEDLRRCPYRFFALRQLGLREHDEIDEEIGKRDFGIWLHEVLRNFHVSLPADAGPEQQERFLEACARAATRTLHLDEAQFLPFWAVWPNMKGGYLKWLSRRGGDGIRFESAERWLERDLPHVRLVGRIDRIDRMPDGTPMLIDYKTESAQLTAKRIAEPLEDVQLAFYAAMLGEDRPSACYLNIGERGEVQVRAQPHLVEALEALLDGLWADLERIRGGAPMLALGEGTSCEHCAARGLCRKDFWSPS